MRRCIVCQFVVPLDDETVSSSTRTVCVSCYYRLVDRFLKPSKRVVDEIERVLAGVL
jgi:hypothetical protein